MRNFVPGEIPRDFDPRLVNILREMGGYLEQVDAGFTHITRGEAPVAGGALVPIPISHHNISHLTDGDDHPMYLFLGTSAALRTGKASTSVTGETDANKQIVYGNVSFRAADSGVVMQEFKSSSSSTEFDGFSIKKTGGKRNFFFSPVVASGDAVARFPLTFTSSDILVMEATSNTLSKKTLTTQNILTFDGTATYCQIQNAGGASVYLDPSTVTAEKTLIIKNWSGTLAAPVGTGNSGDLLVSQGASQPIWQAAATAAAHAMLSATHTDSTPASVLRGALITGQGASPTWSRLALGTSGYFLKSDGTDAGWADLFGALNTWTNTQYFSGSGAMKFANSKGLQFENFGGTAINSILYTAADIFRFLAATATGLIQFDNSNGSVAVTIDTTNAAAKMFVGGSTTPTQILEIAAGTSSLAPFKFTTGTNLTTPITGCMEYDGTSLYFTPTGTTRRTIPYLSLAQTWSAIQDFSVAPRVANGVYYSALNSVGGTVNLLRYTTGNNLELNSGNDVNLIGGAAGTITFKATTGVFDMTASNGGILLKAGTTTAFPLRFQSGTNLTTAVAGTLEFTTDDFFATITSGAARKAFILDDGARLTSGRVPFATTNGRLTDDADMTFATDTLTVTKIAAHTITGTLTIADSINIAVGAGTGTKIGTATTQLIGFWNTAPIVQPTTAVGAATLTGGGGTALTDTDTFDGYTLKQVVKALRNVGLLA